MCLIFQVDQSDADSNFVQVSSPALIFFSKDVNAARAVVLQLAGVVSTPTLPTDVLEAADAAAMALVKALVLLFPAVVFWELFVIPADGVGADAGAGLLILPAVGCVATMGLLDGGAGVGKEGGCTTGGTLLRLFLTFDFSAVEGS